MLKGFMRAWRLPPLAGSGSAFRHTSLPSTQPSSRAWRQRTVCGICRGPGFFRGGFGGGHGHMENSVRRSITDRQREKHRRAPPRLTFHPDTATVLLDELFAQDQSQAGPGFAPGAGVRGFFVKRKDAVPAMMGILACWNSGMLGWFICCIRVLVMAVG
jgi:hypothetical protein